jgi:hypothetical protein
MPVFKNVSDVLTHVGEQDIRFMPIALPYGFNHWSEAKRQLIEDNRDFFLEDSQFMSEVRKTFNEDPGAVQIGVLATEYGQRGFMVILEGSRYVCTDWVKRLSIPTRVVTADAVGASVRKAIKQGLAA